VTPFALTRIDACDANDRGAGWLAVKKRGDASVSERDDHERLVVLQDAERTLPERKIS
jgi:hypothetical protein